MKNIFIRLSLLFILILLVLCILASPILAYDENAYIDDYCGELERYMPEEVRNYLDDKLIDELESESAAYALDMGFWKRTIFSLVNALIAPVLTNFSSLMAVVIISSLLSAFGDTVSGESMKNIFEYVSAVFLAVTAYKIVISQWESATELLDTMNVFMNSILPSVAAMYAAGGNFTAASVSSASLVIILNLMENICRYLLFPMLSICFGLSFVSAVTGESGVRLSMISDIVRKTFTSILVFIMAFMSFVMSYQSVLSESADSIAAKTVKFAAGSMIPVVGSAIGDAVRVIMGSLGLIKSSFGIIAVAVIILLVLPVFLKLWLTRVCFGLCSGISDALGFSCGSKFLSDLKNLYNFVLASVASSAVFFILSLTIFVKTASAVAS